MKNTKWKLEFFAPYDYDGMTSHFEQMALDGWLIVGVKGNLWKYKKIQPQKLKFAVTHFEYFTFNEAAPDNGQSEFLQMCEASGWQMAAHSKTMMVFVTDDENAVPIETDPMVQLKNLHKSVKPMLLGKNAVVVFNCIFNLLPRTIEQLETGYHIQYNVVMLFFALFVLINIDTVDYLCWYKNAKSMIEQQGIFYQQKTNKPVYVLQFVISYIILAICIAFIAWFIWLVFQIAF